MNRTALLMCLTLGTLFVCAVGVLAQNPPPGAKPLQQDVAPIASGRCKFAKELVAIRGQAFDWYLFPGGATGYYSNENGEVTLDIRGWDRFTVAVGLSDDFVRGARETKNNVATILVDGDVVAEQKIEVGEKAVRLDIVLTGHRSLTLRRAAENGTAIVFAEPTLIRGPVAPAFACPVCRMQFATQAALDEHQRAAHAPPPPPIAIPATFGVDQADTDKLAAALKQRVAAKPALAQRLANTQVAVATFQIIGIPAPAVAATFAESFSTALINADFQLVERGPLDKAMRDLRVTDVASIDPAIAKQLGKATGCGLLIVGSIADQADTLVINVRILDAETGRAQAAERIEARKAFIGAAGAGGMPI